MRRFCKSAHVMVEVYYIHKRHIRDAPRSLVGKMPLLNKTSESRTRGKLNNVQRVSNDVHKDMGDDAFDGHKLLCHDEKYMLETKVVQKLVVCFPLWKF